MCYFRRPCRFDFPVHKPGATSLAVARLGQRLRITSIARSLIHSSSVIGLSLVAEAVLNLPAVAPARRNQSAAALCCDVWL